MAIVAVKSGLAIGKAEIDLHCAANLARFKYPCSIHFVEALPRNATGKVHKPNLQETFGALAARGRSKPPPHDRWHAADPWDPCLMKIKPSGGAQGYRVH